MHISEGVLSGPVLVTGAVVAVGSVALSLRKIPWEHLMSVGVLSSAFFVASLIHISLGPASVHLIMNGLMGAILGRAALPAIAVALFLQALLFQFGGLFVLGVNICIMGLPAVLCGEIFRPFLLKPSKRSIAAFCCGALAVALSALLFAIALAFSGDDFMTSAAAVLIAHIPIMGIEGVLTVFIVAFLAKVMPDVLSFSSGAKNAS
ncbi:MAG: cobalt transporter CbiM [Saezia sp.]